MGRVQGMVEGATLSWGRVLTGCELFAKEGEYCVCGVWGGGVGNFAGKFRM